jgi:hypothetical protein
LPPRLKKSGADFARSLGAVLQKEMPKFKKDIVSRFPALSTIGVLGIVFVAIALQSKQIYDNPVILGDIFVPLLIIYSVNFLVSTVAGRIFFQAGRRRCPGDRHLVYHSGSVCRLVCQICRYYFWTAS